MHWRYVGLAVCLSFLAVVAAGESAHASGYHPGFDRAVKEAKWIILHRVVSSHKPKDKLTGGNLKYGFRGRVFLVRVRRSFKGPFRRGDLLYIWDPADRSTAGYFLRKGRDNLTFLVGTKRWRFTRGVRVRGGTKDVAMPIRNFAGVRGRGRGLYLRGWVRLLQLTHVGTRVIPLHDMRTVVAHASSAALLRYVLAHWTARLTKRDATLVKALLARLGVSAGVNGAALELLRKNRVTLSGASLRRQLVSGPVYARGRLLKQINATNAASVRDLLWGWLKRDEAAALDAINTLARYQRRYLVRQLRRHRLPFWLEIPALKRVKNRLGRRYSAAAMRLNRWELVGAGKLVKGKTFSAAYSFYDRKPVWAQMIRLVMPLLPKMKRGPRELAIAIAHTWGYAVRRKGKTARLGGRGKVPLTLTVRRIPGARYKLLVVERARHAQLLCAKSQKRIAISKGRSSVTSMDSTMGGWSYTKTARTCFRRKRGVVHTEIVDIRSLVKNVPKPGIYEVSVDLLHRYSGSEHGLNGWTGMVYSNRLRISLP